MRIRVFDCHAINVADIIVEFEIDPEFLPCHSLLSAPKLLTLQHPRQPQSSRRTHTPGYPHPTARASTSTAVPVVARTSDLQPQIPQTCSRPSARVLD
jgi:hypothetical protein